MLIQTDCMSTIITNKFKTKFIIGELYWHMYPYDTWEHETYWDPVAQRWKVFAPDEYGRVGYMLTLIGFPDFYIPDSLPENYGIFIYGDRKIVVYLDDLCMVRLDDRYIEQLIEDYGRKEKI